MYQVTDLTGLLDTKLSLGVTSTIEVLFQIWLGVGIQVLSLVRLIEVLDTNQFEIKSIPWNRLSEMSSSEISSSVMLLIY